MASAPAAITELIGALGRDHVLVDRADVDGYEVDWTGRFRGRALAVARPGDRDGVAAVMDVCRRHGLALVPQGGNTGLVGGSVPLDGEIVLSTRRMRWVDAVDVAARQVTAGAGATIDDVQVAARAAGMRYPVDFGARGSATIGGTIATNAGGIGVFRHGSTRHQVVGVEAVLGTGGVVSRLGGVVKDNTGYDLSGLLCGSEGTLGVVTAARLRLAIQPAHHVTALLAFDGVATAIDAVGELLASLDTLEAVELIVGECLPHACSTIDVSSPFDGDSPAQLLIEASGFVDPIDALASAVDSLDGVSNVAVAVEPVRRAELWRIRDELSSAIATVGVPVKLDVAVPLAQLQELIDAAPRCVDEAAPGATTWMFGHAADGNVHVNVTGVDVGDDVVTHRVEEAVLELVASLGGSISAEHGIGTAKARWLHLTRSPHELAAMRSIRSALDPEGILNPRVLVSPGA